ncbi:MAG: flagellar filament capping protein FliD [Lachnospiraceae bacterium]|nr:flagellar filament capping protein FliD [Lachnospiraceae bacterium]
MAIRMTGLTSGLDTESIVEALVSAQRTKVTKVKNKLTKNEWTEEIWSDLNKKIYSLYTDELTKFKTQGNYLTKTVTSSDNTVATATATSAASNGSHTLKVNSLAASQSITSAQIDAASTSTRLTSLGMAVGTVINIRGNDGKAKELEVTSSTTIADFTTACKNAGLNASFDTKQKRFFISSKESGEDSGFSITTQTGELGLTGTKLDSIVSKAGETALNNAIKQIKEADIEKLKTLSDGDDTTELAEEDAKLQEAYNQLRDAMGEDVLNGYLNTYISEKEDANNAVEGADPDSAWRSFETAAKAEVDDTVFTDITTQATAYLTTLKGATAQQIQALNGETVYDADGNEVTVTIPTDLQEAYDYLLKNTEDKDTFKESIQSYVESKEYMDANPGVTDQLALLGLQNITSDMATGVYGGMSFVKASNAEIVLDGATLTDTSNDFSVNGLTINLKNTTEGKQITLSASTDTDAVYKMVKGFVNKYNEILEELNKLYNADSAKGYDPLTDEEKEAMTEDQIEKWEKKIKDSLLRRDGTLDGIVTAMRSSLLTTTKIDGKAYSLGSFGIQTSSDYTEKGLLHIMGDEDDETYSAETNKLRAALESDPDAVMKTLAEAGQSLYEALTEKMERTSLSSALTFYNDKKMETERKDYKKQISELEEKLADLEDRYYKRFTAMEKAMAEMQSQTSAISSFMGY